jgi:hypothetical protein
MVVSMRRRAYTWLRRNANLLHCGRDALLAEGLETLSITLLLPSAALQAQLHFYCRDDKSNELRLG